MAYSPNSQLNYGGIESYPGNGGNNPSDVAQVYGPQQTNYGPFVNYTGIALPSDGFDDVARAANGTLNAALPPSCTNDSYGYCVALSSGSTTTESKTCTEIVGGHAVQVTVHAPVGTITDLIQNSYYALFEVNEIEGISAGCGPVINWYPWEPKVEFGDPNLP